VRDLLQRPKNMNAQMSLTRQVPRPRRFVVIGTLRLYYDAVIAVALMAVVAIVSGFIAIPSRQSPSCCGAWF
jgi:hypothetical protein